MEYPKIHSLWKRQEYVKGRPRGTHGPLIEGEYSQIEFGNINKWLVEEKVDGTNIRIFWEWAPFDDVLAPRVQFGGRTSAAQIPCHLLNYLQEAFTFDKLANSFPINRGECVCLYGEGYGPKIQSGGGNYRKDPGFILFDIRVGRWWLSREDVKLIANQLAIPMVPEIGIMTENEIIEFVKSNPLSRCSLIPQRMEGVVCRPDPLMLYRNGEPLIWKLKCKEFD